MSLIYEKANQLLEVTDTEQTVWLPAPSRTTLQKLVVIREESSDSLSEVDDAFTVEVFNRDLVGSPIDVIAVEATDAGKCRVFLDGDPGLRVNDPLVIDGCDVAAYNTTHRVRAIEKVAGGFNITTNRDYTVRGTGGEAQLQIVNEEEDLYRVIDPITSANNVASFSGEAMFQNQDPRRHHGSSHERKIYFRFDSPGNYLLTMGFASNESLGS